MTRPRPLLLAACLLLAGSAAFLVTFGALGVSRGRIPNFDGRVLFAAGRAWLQNTNPYDYPQLSQAVAGLPDLDMSEERFLYPPQTSVICIPLAAFSYPTARRIWLAINFAALAAAIAITTAIVRAERRENWLAVSALLAAVILGNPFSSHVLWLGQTALVAFAASFAAWWLADRGRWLPAGICLALATFKPQISIAVVLWFVLQQQWRVLLTALIAGVAMASKPIILQGPIGVLHAWMAGRAAYDAQPFNVIASSHKVGLETLLYTAGLHAPAWLYAALTAGCTFALWKVRNRLTSIDALALLMVITMSFSTYVHDYDYVALVIPLVIPMWRFVSESRGQAITGLVLLALLCFPKRLVDIAGNAFLDQWRTLVVIALGVTIYLHAVRATRRSTAVVTSPAPEAATPQ